MMKNVRLGEVLVDSGYLTDQQLEQALQVQQSSGGKKLGEILLDLGVITQEQLIDALHTRLRLPIVNLRDVGIPLEVLRLVPEEFARENALIPVRFQGDNLVVATFDPLNFTALGELERRTGLTAIPNLATEQAILNAIDRFYAKSSTQRMAQSANEQFAAIEDIGSIDFGDAELRASSAPVVQLVNTLIEQAYRRRASDIHIEPGPESIRIRFRIDGDLGEILTLQKNLLAPVVTRVKLVSGLNIAEKRLPQDGRMVASVGGVQINIRVSTIHTVFGEKVVLRLLADSASAILSMRDLGMNGHNAERIRSLLQSPNGILLATGPTGSGKSTTLYAALAELSKPEINVVSIEDPVEKLIPGVNQTQVNPKVGLGFAEGLRSLLRQDPDVMLIGEIRDEETAQIAASAAITGHLVLSSLHTNDAASAYMRFIDMGVAPYIVASSIVGIVAQRLVKKICPHCAEEHEPSAEERRVLAQLGCGSVGRLRSGRGCARCNYTGSFGRTAIYEIVQTDTGIRQLVLDRVKTQDIRDYLAARGFQDMRKNALELLLGGTITYKEFLAKTYSVESML